MQKMTDQETIVELEKKADFYRNRMEAAEARLNLLQRGFDITEPKKTETKD